MNELPILIATLPLPPSINEQYATDFKTGKRHKTKVATEFQANCLGYLDYPEVPYEVWTDSGGLRELREKVALMRGKSRLTWLQKPRYKLQVQFVFANDQRDIDGGLKILVDTLALWLDGLNDNRFWNITLEKLIEPTFPHTELVLCPYAGSTASLITRAQQEITALEFYTQRTSEHLLFEEGA